MHDNRNREFDITKGFKTTKADTIEIVDFVFESEEIVQEIKPFDNTSNHLIKIELDDSKTKYCNKDNVEYKINKVDVNSIILKGHSGLNIIYYRNKGQNEKDFRNYLKMKKNIEYRY